MQLSSAVQRPLAVSTFPGDLLRPIRKLNLLSIFVLFLFGSFALSAYAQQPPPAPPAPAPNPLIPPAPRAKTIHLKHVLVIGETKGFEHDSIPDAMGAVYNMGRESGLWDTTLRTDTELL